jgi:hypothetical protein
VTSSTRPPDKELLSLGIDFASCLAAILPNFLFFSYCSGYKNATNICELRHLQKADAGRQGHQKKTVRSVSSAKNGLATNLGRGSR